MSGHNHALRLAVFGFVGEHYGSLCSGHYLVLRELLSRGHQVDFYGIDGVQDAAGLDVFPNCSFTSVKHSFSTKIWSLINRLPPFCRKTISYVFAQPSNRLHFLEIKRIVLGEHAIRPYDAQLFLGLLPAWRVSSIPNISWTQGCAKGESEWLIRHVDLLWEMRCGHLLPMLLTGYLWKHWEAERDLTRADVLFCGSQWAKDCWKRFGASVDKLLTIPYPIDLERFKFVGEHRTDNEGKFRILYLGRIVPRKRFDLVIKAFEIVASTLPHVFLQVIGGFSYGGTAYRRMMERSKFLDRIEYIDSVPRQRVPDYIANSNLILQPSENENYGSACAEAAAIGRPTLLGPTNGTQDYLPNSAYRFEEYTPKAVAEGIFTAIRESDLQSQSIAQRCRSDAETFLSTASVTDDVLLAITSAIRAKKDEP